jgi:hypothetical protein
MILYRLSGAGVVAARGRQLHAARRRRKLAGAFIYGAPVGTVSLVEINGVGGGFDRKRRAKSPAPRHIAFVAVLAEATSARRRARYSKISASLMLLLPCARSVL